jgi:hypothetical protein
MPAPGAASMRLLVQNDGPMLDALKRRLDGGTIHLPKRMKTAQVASARTALRAV